MTFRFDKLTIKAQEAVVGGAEPGDADGNPQIEALHLLAALLAETDGIVHPLLEKIGVNFAQLRSHDRIPRSQRLPKVSGGAQSANRAKPATGPAGRPG